MKVICDMISYDKVIDEKILLGAAIIETCCDINEFGCDEYKISGV